MYIMKAFDTECVRCGKMLKTPNSSNADYIISREDRNLKTLVICPNCYRDNDEVIWGFHGNQSKDNKHSFEVELGRAELFRGRMDSLASSIDFLLNKILERTPIVFKNNETLGRKIKKFNQNKAGLIKEYAGDFNILAKNLKEFNNDWIITKHGMIVGGKQDFCFSKDDTLYIFDQKKREEINRQFEEIMRSLTEILNMMA